jgi:Nuclease-related domain
MSDIASVRVRREEAVVFAELAELSGSPGFAEAIAMLCLRDDAIHLTEDGLTGDSLRNQFSKEALARTEISTLIGLMMRQPLNLNAPTVDEISAYVQRADALMAELHKSLGFDFRRDVDMSRVDDPDYRPMASGRMLREAIFYGGDSAYEFQYRDFAIPKYSLDDDWLEANRGFSIAAAVITVEAIRQAHAAKALDTVRALAKSPPSAAGTNPLSAFILTVDEVAKQSGLKPALVQNVFDAFTFPVADHNSAFKTLQDFNAVNAAPLIPLGDDRYILFQAYTLTEALYEAPFFWMRTDKAYFPQAMIHRGKFTEGLAANCLERVFGKARVFRNVFLPAQKGKTRTEIDTLAVFGNRAIVVQAKSKRLTIEARKGNEALLQDDFKKAVQAACDQAMACAAALLEPACKLADSDGKPVPVPADLKQIFPICVVADHYPALGPQVQQFLKFGSTEVIAPPLATDVFALDAMTEMLRSPLRLLS